MKRFLLVVVFLAMIAGAFAWSPRAAQADDYWDNYWGWYDNSYRPFYSRSSRYDYRPYGSYYGGYYYSRPNADYNYFYRNAPDYYYSPNYGYGTAYPSYGGGGQVQVGPLRFGWR
jgi:hypothetical protein